VDWYIVLYSMFELSGLNPSVIHWSFHHASQVFHYKGICSIVSAPNVRRVWCRISCRDQPAITCFAEVDSVQDRDPIGHMALYYLLL